MRSCLTVLLSAWLFLGCQESKPVKKAVFVILDGIPADVLEKSNTPNLLSIAGKQGYTRAFVGGERDAYSQTPTISAPGYMSLLTATWANKHNVWDNYEQAPNYHYWNIFRIVETANPELKTAIFSTWLDNRTVLIGEGQQDAGDFRIDFAFDGFEKDTVQFPHGNDSKYIFRIDEHVSTEAGRYIAEHGPDLSWVYLEYTDDVGHEKGDSEAFNQAILKADAQIGRIWEGVQQRMQMGEDWLVVITTDHGRDSLDGRGHGGQSDRERTTWMVTNAQDLNRRYLKGNIPVTDITPTILKHLGIEAPEQIASEFDGLPFTGELSFENLRAAIDGQNLVVTWSPVEEEGRAGLYAAFGNACRLGKPDKYDLLSEVSLADGKAVIQLSSAHLEKLDKRGLMKILLKGKHNSGNYWVFPASGEK